MYILVTNNPLVKEQYRSNFRVIFIDTGVIGILTHIRDKIHIGHRLLTHPLSGSIKPNESPYKSVLLTEENKQTGTIPQTDFRSVEIIEESIKTAQKFPHRSISGQDLHDKQVVDLSLISTIADRLIKEG